MGFLNWLFKDQIGYISAHVVVVFLFVFYYFLIPDYWFLSSLLTVVVWGAISIYLSARKKKRN